MNHSSAHAELIGYDMAVKAADEAYQQAGLTAEDVSVVELHDCFSTNELIMYEALVRVIGYSNVGNKLLFITV